MMSASASGWSMIQSLTITLVITCWCGGPFLVTTSAAGSYCRSSRFDEGCGKGYGLSYPFFNASYYSSRSINNTDGHHCGYPDLEVNCRRGRPVLNISNNLYYVLENDYSGYIRVVAVDVEEEECPRPTQNLTLQNTSFAASEINFSDSLIYFYNCSSGYPANTVQHLPCLDALRNNNNNTSSGGDPALRSFVFEQDKYPQNVGYDWYENCQQNVEVPVFDRPYPGDNYAQYVRMGFLLQTQAGDNTDGCEFCELSGGHCLLNQTIENRNQSIYENICSCEGDTKLYHYTCHQGRSVVKDDKCTQCERSGGICHHHSETTEVFLCSCENNTKQYLDICFKGLSIGQKVTIGVFCGIGSLLLSILFLYRRRWSSLYRLWQSNHSSWEDELNPEIPQMWICL